jgi:hypothetical protein
MSTHATVCTARRLNLQLRTKGPTVSTAVSCADRQHHQTEMNFALSFNRLVGAGEERVRHSRDLRGTVVAHLPDRSGSPRRPVSSTSPSTRKRLALLGCDRLDADQHSRVLGTISSRAALAVASDKRDDSITQKKACALQSVWRPNLRSTRQMPALDTFNGRIWVRSGAQAPRSTAR